MLHSIRDAQHALERGDPSQAEAIGARLVREEPKNAAAWHVLGNALLDGGKVDRAISAFRRALRIDDRVAEVHNDLGTAYFQKGWHAEAERCFRNAIERHEAHAVAHGNLGATLRAQGRLGESRRAYQRALVLRLRRLWPFGRTEKRAPASSLPLVDDAERLHVEALAREERRDYQGALRCVRQALERRTDVADYHVTHARLLLRMEDQDGALRAASEALRLEPGSAPLHASMAGLFHPWREDLAEQAARHALELDPASDLAHANLGASLWGQGKLEEAERAAREAVRLNPRELSYRTNLALILKDLDRIDEARALYREAAAEAPEHGTLCLDVGTLALETEGDVATARRMYRTAQKSAGEPRAYMAEALLDFLEGNYGEAWRNYEARKKLSDQKRTHHRQFDLLPDWDGGAVKPGELLVYGEQGLGDEAMFASMYGELERRAPGSRVLCDPRLGALFARSFTKLEVISEPRDTQRARAASLTGLRCKIAAGSLGAFFRRAPGEFPSHGGYLAPDPHKVAAWRSRLASLSGSRKLGLSWVGGAHSTGRRRRSLRLEALLPLLELPDVAWISLQYTDEARDMAELRERRGIALHDCRAATSDMDELASLVQALDAVVSVCNTTVHIAGAVGKPTLVLAPFVPEWRYGLRGERMIWYPSARVLRQPRYGDWGPVVQAARAVVAGGETSKK
jgi:tetratricopeptide (TPR) repeat protein